MELRKTRREDLPAVLEILRQARDFLSTQGVDQWQGGNYPNEIDLQEDVTRGEGYVLAEDGAVLATAMLSFRGEPTYEKIYGGQWLCHEKYGVIHRVATDSAQRGRGLAAALLAGLEALCPENGAGSLRVDTHRDNIPMQTLLKKCGYVYCGTILLEDGVSERVAFEKRVNG